MLSKIGKFILGERKMITTSYRKEEMKNGDLNQFWKDETFWSQLLVYFCDAVNVCNACEVFD